MAIVYCKFPNAGLGNQLFVLARALYFANRNNSKLKFIDAQQVKIGPMLRGERTKRLYVGFFKFQKGFFLEFILKLYYSKKINLVKINDPKIDSDCHEDVKFTKLPHYSQYFDELIPHRETIRELIFNNLTLKNQRAIKLQGTIDVAVHVRMGDFQKLAQGVDFKSVGATRTPFTYFLNEINKIKVVHPEYNFYIFSDGHKDELTPLLVDSNIQIYKSKNDLLDLYQMSKSKILITSAGSTYSYWAGFLGDSEVIQHPDHFCKLR
jgi:hypothetical protein